MKPNPLPLPHYVCSLMDRLEAAGEEVYLVGGSLRDLLLGLVPHDYDLATSARPEQTVAVFSDHRVIETGIKHGTVTILCEGNPVEITTFRIDGAYTDARHPDAVTFTDRITDDLSRRDFTVNAMAYSPARGLIDPFDGQGDLRSRLLRAVGDPALRFTEDALRIMRAFRFSAQLGFAIEEETLRAAANCRMGLDQIAKERITSEFLRLICTDAPAEALTQLDACGIFPYLFGDYRPRPILWELLSRMPRDEGARLGLLLSDTDRTHASALLKALKCSNKQITAACAVLTNGKKSVTCPAEARQFIASCGIYASPAIQASILLGSSPAEALGWIENNQAPCTLGELAVSGRDLIAVGIEGRAVGKTLERLLQAVLEDPGRNQREILLSLAQTKPNTHIFNTESTERKKR